MTLLQLVEKIRREAGFEVFVPVSDRGDLNDFGDYLTYIRSFHNLKNPKQTLTSHILGTYKSGCQNKEDFDPAAYGPVMRDQKREKTEFVTKPIEKTVMVPKKGIIAKLLGTKEPKPEIVNERVPVHKKYYVPQKVPLNSLINTDDTSDAYAVTLFLNAEIYDKVGRPQTPAVTIAGSQALITEIVGYLKSHPEEYNSMIRQLVPALEFPNTNKGILDKIKGQRELKFLNLENIKNATAENTGWRKILTQANFDKYGE